MADRLDGQITVVAPDAGGGKLARRFANKLASMSDVSSDLAYIDKRRPHGLHNVVEVSEVVGHVEGRTAVIVDDMIDTAGTVASAAQLLVDRGAREVFVVATHGLLSGPAVERLQQAPVREVVVTNTVPITDEKRFDKLSVLSIAPIVADALGAVFEDTSVSEIFRGDNM
jgi:ribose-phosphate pyrophosphokinase